MLNRIRDARTAKGLTLAEVAKRCDPPTTAQTIGRLETGTRTLSLDWLNRIADALDLDSSALLSLPDSLDIPVAAVLDADGARAPAQDSAMIPPGVEEEMVGLRVATGVGDYRSGDEIWCARRGPSGFAGALNRDVLVPRPGGRFLFGRLIGREEGKLQLLPLVAGGRQQVVSDPDWIGVATRLVRAL